MGDPITMLRVRQTQARVAFADLWRELARPNSEVDVPRLRERVAIAMEQLDERPTGA